MNGLDQRMKVAPSGLGQARVELAQSGLTTAAGVAGGAAVSGRERGPEGGSLALPIRKGATCSSDLRHPGLDDVVLLDERRLKLIGQR